MALTIATAACSSSSPHHSAAPSTTGGSGGTVPAATVVWTSCSGSRGPSGYQCATVPVPRDPKNPLLGTIQMALDRHPAHGTKLGSILVNPGGPGVSGVDFLPTAVSVMPSDLLDHFDIVGFDPPGVARTAPIICLSAAGIATYFHADPAPPGPNGAQTVADEAKAYAAGCESRSGAELPYVSTVDAAMDLDVVRQALGDAKLTFFGFSYGTFLGATYAGLYPTHVRAMVLDGALNPAESVIDSNDAQSAAIEGDLNALFASCASSHSCAWKPAGSLLSAYEALAARVRTHPLAVPGTKRTVGPAELLYGTGWGLYDTQKWPFLERSLAAAEKGNGAGILALFDDYTGRNQDGTYTNEFEANAAINCLDAPGPSVAAVQAAAPAAAAAAPVFGLPNLYSLVGCDEWPVPPTGRPGPIHAPGSPPIVVVGSTGDPATPYANAQALAAQLDHGVLLTRIGNGHTGYPYSSCIRNYVDDYLINLTPPPAGTQCKSD